MATVGQPDAMRRITVHYANPPPGQGTEDASFHGLGNEFLEFVIVDVVQDQEGLYQSIVDDTYNNHTGCSRTTAKSDNSHYYHHGESSSPAETSRTSDIHEQIAHDFEYARQLQEMEDLNIGTNPDEEEDDISCVPSPSDSDDDGENQQETARQDDDNNDPDNMTYEQRQALVESVGTEGRGLSDQLISYLVPWKYKSGFLSRKRNHEDCPICLSAFKNRERIVTLPCKHNYHASCVARWLKIDKACPVCKYEVFGPS